jgi:alpha-beta hydrolase superfamily lysophospholipase
MEWWQRGGKEDAWEDDVTHHPLIGALASQLRARQGRAILSLLSEPNVQAAARASRVGDRTLRRWLSEDGRFQAAYREARSVALGQATARLQAAAGEAVDTLKELMALKARPDVRARAALGVLAAAMKVEELDNLVARVEALEQRSNARPVLAGSGR